MSLLEGFITFGVFLKTVAILALLPLLICCKKKSLSELLENKSTYSIGEAQKQAQVVGSTSPIPRAHLLCCAGRVTTVRPQALTKPDNPGNMQTNPERPGRQWETFPV